MPKTTPLNSTISSKTTPDTNLKNNQRTKLITNPEQVVSVGEKMLFSSHLSEVIGGLVLMTGLQCVSILKTAILEPCSNFSLILTERHPGSDSTRVIPTLTRATNVLKAFNHLKNTVDTRSLALKTLNSHYLPFVIEACEKSFDSLIPHHRQNDNLYTHLYKSVYGVIATYYYCPPGVSAIDYQAYICGQENFFQGKPEEVRQKIASSLHYFDYQIGQDLKTLDNPVGIKLADPSVTVIEKFQEFAPQAVDLVTAQVEDKGESQKEKESDNFVNLLEHPESRGVLKRLIQLTGCTASELLLNQFFEVTSAKGETQLCMLEGRKRRKLNPVGEGEVILPGISQLRKDPQIQELLKLSAEEIEEKLGGDSPIEVRVG